MGPSGARLLGSGPLGRLDTALHALRPLRPCDPRNGAFIGQCMKEIKKSQIYFLLLLFLGRLDTSGSMIPLSELGILVVGSGPDRAETLFGRIPFEHHFRFVGASLTGPDRADLPEPFSRAALAAGLLSTFGSGHSLTQISGGSPLH